MPADRFDLEDSQVRWFSLQAIEHVKKQAQENALRIKELNEKA